MAERIAESLSEKIKSTLLGDCIAFVIEPPKFTVWVMANGDFAIKYHQMYEPPPINLDTLTGIAEIFGTTKINVDNYGYSGCESCDWGSDYGHEIYIKEPTKNIEGFNALTDDGKREVDI